MIRRRLRILVLLSLALPAPAGWGMGSRGEFTFVHRDGFTRYREGSDASPAWESDSFGWEVREGALVWDSGGRGSAFPARSPHGRRVTAGATRWYRATTASMARSAGGRISVSKDASRRGIAAHCPTAAAMTGAPLHCLEDRPARVAQGYPVGEGGRVERTAMSARPRHGDLPGPVGGGMSRRGPGFRSGTPGSRAAGR